MKKRLTTGLATAFILATAAGTVQADVVLDGILGGGDIYTNSQVTTWFNGHRTAESTYGDFDTQYATTTVNYGVGTAAGDNSGTQYFFLHIEAPLYAKNMIWQDRNWHDTILNTDPNAGLTEEDVSSYRTHHETHHNPFSMNLDFGGATGSEKLVLLNSSGDNMFEADLAGNADNAFGLVGYKDSSDYLLDSGMATEALSLARDTTMSFEFQFTLDEVMNNQILSYLQYGLEFHMSPERGLPVPAPASLAIFGLGGMVLTKRRR